MALNPLERARKQRAKKLLGALQDDLYAQMNLEKDESRHKGANVEDSERKAQIARLLDSHERERIWTHELAPLYKGTEVCGLPKTREFWREVDVSLWRKDELDAACTLLGLPTSGKKMELITRIQDWVHEPEILARLQHQRSLELQHEAILASGRVFAFGSNSNGELGLGHRRACEIPTELESFRGAHVTNVYSGFDANFAFARTRDGQVFAWGGGGRALFDSVSADNRTGQPELQERGEEGRKHDWKESGRSSDVGSCFLLPRRVESLSSKELVTFACGRTGGHIAMTSGKGECFTWGRGVYGELGTATVWKDGDEAMAKEPVHVKALNYAHIVAVSVGNIHTAAITDTGKLYTWGSCWSGQLGLGERKRIGVTDRRLQYCFTTPTVVEALEKKRITRVSCGAVHTGVVSADGQLFTFGCGDGGRLGLGNNKDALQPELVTALINHVVLDTCCGNWHTLCIAQEREKTTLSKARSSNLRVSTATNDVSAGYVYAFGSGLHGQLGLGKQKYAAFPTCLPALRLYNVRFSAIATSSHHSCAVADDGNLYTWGRNLRGCLGRIPPDVDATEFAEPGVVDHSNFRTFGVGPIVSVAVGHRFTLIATGPFEACKEQSMAHI